MTNTEDHAFDFTDANYKVVERILAKYPANYKKSATIPLLDLAQRQCGNFLPLAAMQKVARLLGISEIEVFEVATFYTMFNRKRVGKFFIQLCGTTPCMVNGSEEIKATIESELDIHTGETTSDGLFTLLEVECLGACVNAPMIQINDDFFECLTPESTKAILTACREQGAPPRLTQWGSKPMNGQVSCEGPMGKTSLMDMPAVPTPRELPRNLDPATVKQEMMY
jgi:NADH dehydrogenase (ubiquinone) flavoprotein 2